MAPARTARRGQHDINQVSRSNAPENTNGVLNENLFLEPMMGTPLQIYIEKDVDDRDLLVDLATVSRACINFTRRVRMAGFALLMSWHIFSCCLYRP
jgi:hypothetical protein